MSCNICYRKTSYFARCKVSLPDPEKSLWRWKLSTLIDEWHAGISQLNDFRKKKGRRVLRLKENLASNGERRNPPKIAWIHEIWMQTARHSWPIPVYPLGFSLIWRGYYWDCRKKRDWSPSQTFQSQRDLCSSIHPCAMNMRLLGLCSSRTRNNQQGYKPPQILWEMMRLLSLIKQRWREYERIRSSKTTQKQKNPKQLQAIGYFRLPVLLLFLRKTGGTMRWALRLYQNRSRRLNEKLLRFCASHFSGCTRPGKNGVGGKIPWRRQWIDGFYAICINLYQFVICTYDKIIDIIF